MPNTVIQSATFNAAMDDIAQTFNTPTPVVYGGTGAADASGARTNLGVPSNADLGWKLISSQSVTGIGAVGFLADTQLYRFLRLTYSFVPTVTMVAGCGLRTSTNLGVSFDSGAADYNYHGIQELNGGTSAIAPANASYFPIVNSGISGNFASGSVVISNFNTAALAIFECSTRFFDNATGIHKTDRIDGYRANGVARNALQFLSLGGTFSGAFRLEGML